MMIDALNDREALLMAVLNLACEAGEVLIIPIFK